MVAISFYGRDVETSLLFQYTLEHQNNFFRSGAFEGRGSLAVARLT